MARRDLNTSIVSDISALNDGDFNMIVEQLLSSKPKKSKRTKKQYHRKVQTAHSVPALNAVNLFDTHDEVDNGAMNATFSPELANASFVSFNDTCTTVNSENLESIFAYFDQDVTTHDLLFSDDEADDESATVAALAAVAISATDAQTQSQRPNSCEQFASTLLQHFSPTEKPKSKKKQQLQQRAETKEIQCKSKAILNRIQQFNGIEPKKSDCDGVGTKPPKYIQKNRPVSVLSTSSTASLHDSDSDSTTFKKPCGVVKNGNVRSKVAFFSDHSSSDRSSSTSPSIQSNISDDDDFQFQRTQSKRNFKRNRDFFEGFFKVKGPDQTINVTRDEKKSTGGGAKNGTFFRAEISNDNETQIDAHEKLKAVQTYVQTQYLLERIERLVSAISNLDETRLSSMNLKLLKKFLTFIRDCSYNCTEVCNSISENVLTDFEKNVMSAEELLYSALKDAHTAQVHRNFLHLFADALIPNTFPIIPYILNLGQKTTVERFPNNFFTIFSLFSQMNSLQKMNYKNRMRPTQISVSTSYVCKHRCNA